MTPKLVRLFETNKGKLEMKAVTLIRCILLGLTFVVFGLNGLWQTRAQRRQAMSYSVPTLLTRNLHDVFGENDPARRRAGPFSLFLGCGCAPNCRWRTIISEPIRTTGSGPSRTSNREHHLLSRVPESDRSSTGGGGNSPVVHCLLR